MKKMILVLVMVLSLSGCKYFTIPEVEPANYVKVENERTINVGYDTVWNRLMYWCAKQQVIGDEINAGAGTVKTTMVLTSLEYCDCGASNEGYADHPYGTLGINVVKNGAATQVIIRLQSLTAIWRGDRHDQVVTCYSNGDFEKEIFDYLENGKYTAPKYSNGKR